MIRTEKLIPLTTQDIEKLKGRKTGGIGCFLIAIVLIIIAMVILYVVLNETFCCGYNFEGDIGLIPAGVAVLPLGLVLIILAYIIKHRYTNTAGKDIRGGTKSVLTAQVQKMYTEDLDPGQHFDSGIKTAYMVDIDNKPYDVKEAEFHKYSVGMWVDIHTAPQSGEFLGIYDLNDGKLLTDELL